MKAQFTLYNALHVVEKLNCERIMSIETAKVKDNVEKHDGMMQLSL